MFVAQALTGFVPSGQKLRSQHYISCGLGWVTTVDDSVFKAGLGLRLNKGDTQQIGVPVGECSLFTAVSC
jgi:hypothetical protein